MPVRLAVEKWPTEQHLELQSETLPLPPFFSSIFLPVKLRLLQPRCQREKIPSPQFLFSSISSLAKLRLRRPAIRSRPEMLLLPLFYSYAIFLPEKQTQPVMRWLPAFAIDH